MAAAPRFGTFDPVKLARLCRTVVRMAFFGASRHSDGAPLPWFRERPHWTVGVAIVLAVGVFMLRLLIGDAPSDAVTMLFTLPIALVALAFGRTAGIGAGLVACCLVAFWVVARDIDVSVIGWLSRLLPFLLLGGLLGDASDRLADAAERQRALEAATQRQRDATEVNDTLVQGMAAAKWSLEAGRVDSGLKTLTETIELGHQLVSKLLREADMGVAGSHRPPARDFATGADADTDSDIDTDRTSLGEQAHQ